MACFPLVFSSSPPPHLPSPPPSPKGNEAACGAISDTISGRRQSEVGAGGDAMGGFGAAELKKEKKQKQKMVGVGGGGIFAGHR